MNGRRLTKDNMVATKSKNKVRSCSTPDHTLDSPSRDSDSMCDSETASPVPFLCTQDGAEGVTDVVWNYYNTTSKNSLPKNSTPISRKAKKPHRLKLPERELQPSFSKRRITRLSQKKTQLPSELLELNQYVDKLMEKRKISDTVQKPQSGSEEDIFSDATDCSPKSIFRPKKCLRKNVLSSKFAKSESENGLESDDSINECLLKASQAVEETMLSEVPAKRPCYESNLSFGLNRIQEDSTDAILKNLRSPYENKFSKAESKFNKAESPGLKNDSFDNLVGNLNDSALEKLSQMPVKNRLSTRKIDRSKTSDTSEKLKELVIHESPSRFSFARHSSMPESPSVSNHGKATSNAVLLGRYNSMPFNDSKKDTGDSPIRCTPIEIQKKHQQAREKLLAKRLLPFTQTQQTSYSLPSQLNTNPSKQNNQPTKVDLKIKFQPKVPFSADSGIGKSETIVTPEQSSLKQNIISSKMDLKSLIEKKRQEALIKLRSKHLQK